MGFMKGPRKFVVGDRVLTMRGDHWAEFADHDGVMLKLVGSVGVITSLSGQCWGEYCYDVTHEGQIGPWGWLESWLMVPAPVKVVSSCTCVSLMRGCRCGAFRREMEGSGKKFNPVLGFWEVAR